jgi:hypothetical protein
MDKVIGFYVSFLKKLGGGIVEFIGENLGKAKGLKYSIFPFFHGFVLYYEVSMGIRSG